MAVGLGSVLGRIPCEKVGQPLVVGVRVHRGDDTPIDAEGLVKDLGDGGQAVGGAGGIGNNMMVGRIIESMVYTHNYCQIFVLGGS